MTLLYLDSSAWVKRYFQELGSAWLRHQFIPSGLLASSTLALIEVAATCARKRRAGTISPARFQFLTTRLLQDWKDIVQVDLTPGVVARALELAGTCALRGADSVHLASALTLLDDHSLQAGSIVLVTSDLELKAAALKVGLAVLDPQEQSQPFPTPPVI